MQHGSDSTPTVVQQCFTASSGDLEALRRGRSCKDYLIQRLWLCNERGDTRVIIDEPRALSNKGGWAHFQAAQELWPNPRRQGHVGILVLHGCYDRAVWSGLDNR